jgi:acetylornithine deacetylase/succinyl-diaminopimelate desuccinylase-like protein
MTDLIDRLTHETVELLQALIRNRCVNEGTPESGHEVRNAELLRNEIENSALDIQTFETLPGRMSMVARYAGTDSDAPTLCLMGHTDVVPANPDGWDVDPFGGELIDGEVWGRGAVDMLNLTSSMAVAFREVVRSGKRYPGDIVFFAVADEEHGGEHGARPLVENEWDALRCDYVLTEYGGTPITNDAGTVVLLTTGEKGGGGRRMTVRGEPGHGSMPFGVDSALIKSAEIVRRIAAYDPGPRLDEMFAARLQALGLPLEARKQLLDPARLHDALAEMDPGMARNLHSCSHMSFSPNVLASGGKSNTIPDTAELIVDIRILPGDTQEDVDAHLRAAIGEDLMGSVEWERLFPGQNMSATSSPTDTRLWDVLTDSIRVAYPGAQVLPSMVTGGTDARFFRHRGVPSYGAGLLSPEVPLAEFMNRFHGHNERIDIESLKLTTQLWLDVLDRLWV